MTQTPVTPETLTPLLRAQFGDETLACVGLRRPSIGNGQEIWLVDAAGEDGHRRLVLRLTAPGPLEWTDRQAEADAMGAALGAGLPVPRVFRVRGADSEFGRPYMLMEAAPGEPGALAKRDQRDSIAQQVAALLPRIHAIATPGAVAPAGGAAAAVKQEVARWAERYRQDRPFVVPILGVLLADLAARAPADSTPAVLLWGDPGYHNVLATDGRLTALLDWELSHVGHPLEDLGIIVQVETGRVSADAIVRAYEQAAGQPVDRAALDYFTAMAFVTRAVMVLAGAGGFLAGRTSEPSTLALGMHLLCDYLARAARLLGWTAREAEPLALAVSPPPRQGPLPPLGDAAPGLAAFLRSRVLPATADPRLVRGLKTAAALVETMGWAAQHQGTIDARRAKRETELRRALSLDPADPADFETQLIAAHAAPAQRAAVENALMEDLADQRLLLRPLDDLYGGPRAKA